MKGLSRPRAVRRGLPITIGVLGSSVAQQGGESGFLSFMSFRKKPKAAPADEHDHRSEQQREHSFKRFPRLSMPYAFKSGLIHWTPAICT